VVGTTVLAAEAGSTAALIHDPAGMVVKSFAFLVLVWVCGAMVGRRP